MNSNPDWLSTPVSKEKKLKLTDYETGEPIYVLRSAIQSVRQLSAEHFADVGDVTQQEVDRTRIGTKTDMFLVRERAEAIMET